MEKDRLQRLAGIQLNENILSPSSEESDTNPGDDNAAEDPKKVVNSSTKLIAQFKNIISLLSTGKIKLQANEIKAISDYLQLSLNKANQGNAALPIQKGNLVVKNASKNIKGNKTKA